MNRIIRSIAFLTFLVCSGGCSTTGMQAPPPVELRGVWLNEPGILDSRESIARTMQFLAEHNFNAVFPVAWNGGRTLYPSKVLQHWFGITTGEGDRDVLAEVIAEAHMRGLAVIPAFTFGFAAPPPTSDALASTKPHWLARDRAGNAVLREGVVWLNPIHPEVQEFYLSLVAEVVKNYDVDGILGGDRLLAEPIEAGYDSVTVERFRETHAGNDPPPDIHDTHWKHWRAVQINTVAQKLYWRAKAYRAGVVMGWAPLPYRNALNAYLQDWRSWITENPYGEYYADFIVPLIAISEVEAYKRTLDAQHKDSLKIKQQRRYLFPGVLLTGGSRPVTEEELIEAVRYNRASGYNGEVFSSVEELRRANGKLAAALKHTYYSTPARLPFLGAGEKARGGATR